MNQESVIVRCASCAANNRVPKARLRERPLCGKCKSPLQPESVIVTCSNCGTKNRVFSALLNDHPNCGKCHAPLRATQSFDRPVEITDQTFQDEVLSFSDPVLMDYYSPMCGYCKMLDPILDQLASKYAGRLKIGKMNVDQNPMTASRYDIMSTPTMIFFKDGKEVKKLFGTVSREELENNLEYILSSPQ